MFVYVFLPIMILLFFPSYGELESSELFFSQQSLENYLSFKNHQSLLFSKNLYYCPFPFLGMFIDKIVRFQGYRESEIKKNVPNTVKAPDRNTASAFNTFDIKKSLELKYDPQSQALVPVPETKYWEQSENALLLFMPKTFKEFKKLTSKFEREERDRRVSTASRKPFQTSQLKKKTLKK